MKEGLYARLNPLQRRKSLNREGFGTFDAETKDGLKGKEIFCWKLALPKPRSNKLQILGGRNGLEEMFEFFRNRVDNKAEQKFLTIYVHNLGFDSRFIEDYCIKNKIERLPILSGSKMIAYTIDDLMVRFVDTVQFLFSSQEKAEILWEVDEELRKIDCQSIFAKPYKEWTKEEKDKVEAHNVNDVLALHQIMEKFRDVMFETINVDVLSIISLASMSMKGYRRYMEEPIINPFLIKTKKGYRIDKIKEEFVRASYFGGRTECFDLNPYFAEEEFLYPSEKHYSKDFIEKHMKKLAYVDRVSMYPAEMFGQFFPMGVPYWINGHENIQKELDDGKLAVIECEFIPSNDYYPVLPSKRNGKLCFTNETNKGVYCSPEIDYAMERGYKFNFLKALVYPEKKKIFKKYIGRLFKLKSTSKGGKRQGSKISMNSLYGKFGQAMIRDMFQSEWLEREDYDEFLDFIETGAMVKYSAHYDKYIKIEIVEKVMKRPFQNVAIASFTTSYARVSLVQQMNHLLENLGIKTIYCDTDSTVVFSENLHKMEISKDLGGWDIETSFEYFHAYAPKSYVMIKEDGGFLLKLKGAPREGVREILKTSYSITEIEHRIQDSISEAERYDTFKSSLRHGFALRTRKQTKHFSFEYSKRKVLANKTTRPWRNEDNE